ncbi:MAG: PAS domain S-box protein [Sphingomonas sp.]|uniref:sensor histidine kinase n=1 Tax=Sphingomonas sp. TaxID=28214 RepID=UPI001ACEB8D8|nr:HWE histidine kinase domain-containing protein [Sphingomonas sp.]MBN8808263.1 PAS domain S-box protein [Sphingomonas sp.]
MPLSRDIDTLGLGAILKTALDAVVVMRFDGTIAGWSDNAQRTFGWSFDEAVGRRMSELIIPHRFREAHEQGLARFLMSGDAVVLDSRLELEALHRDGHEMPVELSITRTSSSGEPVFLGFLRDISARRAAERRQQLMIGELNHRVKNLLGVVSAIAHQTARSSSSLEDFEPAFVGRLQALGHAHEILSAATWERASLTSLAKTLLGAFCGDEDGRVRIEGPDLLLSPRQFLSVSMILHELTTNAVKYGALGSPDGAIDLSWTETAGAVALSWCEHVAGPVVPPTRQGFGSKMIQLSVRHELKGQATSEWSLSGLVFRVSFDMD